MNIAKKIILLMTLCMVIVSMPKQYPLGAGSISVSIIGVSWDETNSPVIKIDETTGTGSTIGYSGFKKLNSLAQSASGLLYSVGDDSGGSSLLITIDSDSGKGTQIAKLNFGTTTPDVRGLTFSPSGILFAVNNPGNTWNYDDLYIIDPYTGIGTIVGSTGLSGIQGLDFSPSGTLYGWDIHIGLVTIDTETGIATDVNSSVGGTVDIQTITFTSDGRLFGAKEVLYQINSSTGEYTFVGSGAYADVRGIEYLSQTYTTPTPSPSSSPIPSPSPSPAPTLPPLPTPSLPPIPTPTTTQTPAEGSGIVFGFVNDSDENALRGVTVTIDGNGFSDSVETGGDGYYEFSNLAAGDYTLTYEKDGYQTQTQEVSLGVDEVMEVETVVMEITEKSSISGYVIDIKGTPVESVKLKIKGIKTGYKGSTASDADGFFEFKDLDADTYVIVAKKKGYKRGKQTVTLEEGESQEVEIELKKTTKRRILFTSSCITRKMTLKKLGSLVL